MSKNIDITIKRTLIILIGIWLIVGFLFIGNKVLCQNFTFAETDVSKDGLGTIADIGILKSQLFLHNDDAKIISSLMLVPKIYMGAWWIIEQSLALFLSPDNVYDLLVLIFWLLNIFAGYYLFRTLNLDRFSAAILGIAIAGLDIFQSRISIHLIMAAIFVPLLQIAFAYKIIEHPSGKNVYIFSILCFLTFLSNEYYGYFGFIFSISLIIFYYLLNIKRIKEFNLKEIIWGILIFCVGMMIVYANIFRTLFSNSSAKGLIIHPLIDFIVYSVHNPLEILYSPLYGWKMNSFTTDEFTFHLGVFIFIFMLSNILLANIRKMHLDNKLILPTFFSGFILALFGLDIQSPISLDKITYIFAPQFRVGTRAYLWVSFAIILIAAIIYRDIVKYLSTRIDKSSSSLSSILSFVLVLVLCDTTLGFYIKGPHLYPLPDNKAYKAISTYPPGLLLELPFYGPFDPPEPSYRYLYNFFDHKKELINYPASTMYQYDPVFALGLDQFKYYLNNPNPAVINLLSKAGVKYIAVSDSTIKAKFDALGYKPIVSQGGVAIYEFNATNEIDLKTLVLCNAATLKYDLSNLHYLPTNVGIISDQGISSNGKAGLLLSGPYAHVGAGTYTLKLYGTLSAGLVNIEIVSKNGTVIHQQFTLDTSVAANDGFFDIQKTVNINNDVNDLEVRVMINKNSIIEVQGYIFSKVDTNLQCQKLLFSNKPE